MHIGVKNSGKHTMGVKNGSVNHTMGIKNANTSNSSQLSNTDHDIHDNAYNSASFQQPIGLKKSHTTKKNKYEK